MLKKEYDKLKKAKVQPQITVQVQLEDNSINYVKLAAFGTIALILLFILI